MIDDVRLAIPLKSLAFLYQDVLNRGAMREDDEPPCCAACCGPCGAMMEAFDAGILNVILRAAPTTPDYDWWIGDLETGQVNHIYIAQNWFRADPDHPHHPEGCACEDCTEAEEWMKEQVKE